MDLAIRIQDLKHVQGRTYGEIQADLGVSSKTVAKALIRPAALVEGYQRSGPAPRPALGPYLEQIEELLKGQDWANEAYRKVRRTARWVYRQLRQRGYAGAESTVRTYVRERFKQPRPACPIEHLPGQEVQFDFGFYPVKLGGVVRTVSFLGVCFPYSTRRYAFAYPAERQECLFDGMERTCQRAGGRPLVATLDNTKLAVSKVLEGKRRDETQAYGRFRATLGLYPRYTNLAAGWEKGHVEGTVGFIKRQALLDLEVAGWAELQAELDRVCDEDAAERRHGEKNQLVAELFLEEKQRLLPLRYAGRRSYRTLRAQVSPGGLIQVDRSQYSVPIRLRGREVRVRAYWDELVVVSEGQEVARHERDWAGHAEHYQVEHYLSLLKRAPALLDHGKPFVRMPQWLKEMRERVADDKGLIELLLAMEAGKYSLRRLQRAWRSARSERHLTCAVIRQKMLLQRSGGRQASLLEKLSEAECGRLGQHHYTAQAADIYDDLLRIDPAAGKEVG